MAETKEDAVDQVPHLDMEITEENLQEGAEAVVKFLRPHWDLKDLKIEVSTRDRNGSKCETANSLSLRTSKTFPAYRLFWQVIKV